MTVPVGSRTVMRCDTYATEEDILSPNPDNPKLARATCNAHLFLHPFCDCQIILLLHIGLAVLHMNRKKLSYWPCSSPHTGPAPFWTLNLSKKFRLQTLAHLDTSEPLPFIHFHLLPMPTKLGGILIIRSNPFVFSERRVKHRSLRLCQ
jgi:hypothetical protein